MYKLIIVDDERRIREGLKNIVDWEKLGFMVTELFPDGQDVIEYLDYVIPDVILTDIKMNHVSGLDVAKYVFEHRLPCKVVLISGYQEFELALQGLKYGAEDYLLKPTEVDKIEATFAKIRSSLDEKKVQYEKIQHNRTRMDEAIQLLEERFFSDIVMGVVDSKEYVANCMGILYPEVDAERCSCFLADVYIEDYDHFMNEVWEYSYDQLEVNLTNFLRIYKDTCCFHIVYKSDNLIELVGINIEPDMLEESQVRQVLERLILEMEQNFRFHTSYKLRHIYSSIYQIAHARKQVLENQEDEEVLAQYLKEQKKLLMFNVTMGNVVTAQKLYHNILEELSKQTVQRRNNIIIDIMSTMNTVLWENNPELARSLQSYFNYSDVLAMTKLQEVKNWSDRIFDRIKMADDLVNAHGGITLIEKARDYIRENIYKDISQEETANYLYICPSYLSRIFRKQTGEGFLQYVTRMKMEKAIELLKDPRYKTYQVGEMLGYKTPRYFARLFRTHTGMNPSEYRRNILQLGEKFEK